MKRTLVICYLLVVYTTMATIGFMVLFHYGNTFFQDDFKLLKKLVKDDNFRKEEATKLSLYLFKEYKEKAKRPGKLIESKLFVTLCILVISVGILGLLATVGIMLRNNIARFANICLLALFNLYNIADELHLFDRFFEASKPTPFITLVHFIIFLYIIFHFTRRRVKREFLRI